MKRQTPEGCVDRLGPSSPISVRFAPFASGSFNNGICNEPPALSSFFPLWNHPCLNCSTNRTGNAYCRPVRLLEESQPWSSKRRHAIVPCSGYFLRRGCVPLNSVTCASRMSIVSRVSSRYEGKVPRHDGSQRQEGFGQLLEYLDHARAKTTPSGTRRRSGEEPLFLTESGRSFTENTFSLLFGRLRKRAGMKGKEVGSSLLRDSFAVRYLQAGGDLFTLRELLGHEESIRVKRVLGMNP